MSWYWIILGIIFILFVSYFFVLLFVCQHAEVETWGGKICRKVFNWKNIKKFYAETYKMAFYISVSVIVLIFLISVIKDYYPFVFGKQTTNNIKKTASYFIPQSNSSKAKCFALNANSIFIVKAKDTFNLTEYPIISKDTAKRTVFIINSYNRNRKNDSTNIDSENSGSTTLDSSIPKNNSNILVDTSNIISHTSNILNYLTIFLALMGIIAGVAIFKYINIINNLKKETERLENKTLDAGLTTIAAVPLVEATQITSDEYHLAIETITKSIVENRENITDNPKYSKLLVVEALHYWNNRNYNQAVHILRDALKLAYQGGMDNTVKTIHYHLARVYKQKYFENKKEYDRKEALKYAENIGVAYSTVIKMSICLIDDNPDDLKELILNYFNKNNIYNFENISSIIKRYANDDDFVLDDFAKMTAMPTILIKKLYLDNSQEPTDSDIKNSTDRLKELYECEVVNWKGANIKASWYRTMYKFSNDEKFNRLFKTYKNMAKSKGINRIFDCEKLVEIDIDEID